MAFLARSLRSSARCHRFSPEARLPREWNASPQTSFPLRGVALRLESYPESAHGLEYEVPANSVGMRDAETGSVPRTTTPKQLPHHPD
jgi:hypothetical protein